MWANTNGAKREPGQACLLKIVCLFANIFSFGCGPGPLESGYTKEHETMNFLSIPACFRGERGVTESRAGGSSGGLFWALLVSFTAQLEGELCSEMLFSEPLYKAVLLNLLNAVIL